ncbi:MAG: hypothetical protein II841_02090 [Bacteroidales bacterium]|nr:hypothetical protein [Bacteroidales bacterium]
MKPNKSHTKLYVFLLTLWEVIKDALSPSWAASMPAPTRKEETIPSRNGDEQAQNTVTPMDSSDLPSSPSSGPTETAEGTSTPLAIQADRTINEAALAMNEEVVRLRERLKELEKDATERIDVARTMDELRACAKRERENSGKIGRPPKQYKKVTFNLQMRWSLLYELGNDIGAIELEKTQFYNIAIELLLKTNYPQLYALYIRSITNEEQSETIRD